MTEESTKHLRQKLEEEQGERVAIASHVWLSCGGHAVTPHATHERLRILLWTSDSRLYSRAHRSPRIVDFGGLLARSPDAVSSGEPFNGGRAAALPRHFARLPYVRNRRP